MLITATQRQLATWFTAHLEHVTFGVLMDTGVELQDEFEVTARAPVRCCRVEVAAARFLRECSQDVVTVS